MQTKLAPRYRDTETGREAESILRNCVHCGFCTATCPTYQLLGDELDGPRGRIYLIKQVLEGQVPTRATQLHLDRCLTCRNCESTCPSGVQYGHLLEIGRQEVEAQVPRPMSERLARRVLKTGMLSSAFGPAMKLGQLMRDLLPISVQAKVPAARSTGRWPERQHARKVLLLAGCVQPAMMPSINFSTARVLDAVGIQTLVVPEAGCCGAVRYHLNDHEGGLDDMRHNIDAWWPFLEAGHVEAIVMNASGCGAMVKDYGYTLRNDPAYAEKARRVSELTRDVSELLPDIAPSLKGRIAPIAGRVAWHPPCTLQHAQKIRGVVEQCMGDLGFDVRAPACEPHLCCGSAGTYSVLQPELAHRLRDRKLEALQAGAPRAIASANIGCITHLQSGTDLPVRHWIELLDEALAPCNI